jgi:eukaryotic-like serine/threonine-protein kinase
MSPGDQLGPYQILSAIGAGGMGEVWKARDTRLDRVVAIKRLKAQHSARFEQEARAIAALNHPHICQIYDIGPDYLVLEYVEGKPLRGPLPAEQAWTLARQIASALEAAHAKGILHRDLKPTNILVNSSGAKLLDFGLAKLLDDADATQTIGIAGTPLYMSPEQVEGKPLDTRSDVFSFGVVLYELLTGRRPFDSLASVLRDDPAPSGHDVVTKCMAKQPAQRFDSMTRVLAALRAIETKPASAQPSIAVLPFANMSRDADDEYFSDGLAEEIINLLAHVPNLKVTARTSAFAFRGKEQDITKIAKVLRVNTILEGSVRRAGNRIRVTAQLINAADGYHLWSERYDRELTDVFAIQDEIAAAITEALQLKLGAAPAQRHMPTVAAYEAYLKYRYYQWKFTPEDSKRSRECLEQALALDPKFALPYVGLADHYLAFAAVGGITAKESMPRARELAQRALELDPDLAEAHAMLGIVAGQYDFDWKECERRFTLAMAREPIAAQLRVWYANFACLCLDHAEEGRRQLALVLEQDPLCQMWHYSLTLTLGCLGLQDQAIEACRRAVELDPQFWIGWCRLGMLLATDGRHEEALECAQKGFAGAPWSPYSIGLLAGVLEPGQTKEAENLLATLRADSNGGPTGLACYHLVRGETDSAVEALGRAVGNRFPGILVIVVRPFEPLLRQSAGWPGLLKKANLTEAP